MCHSIVDVFSEIESQFLPWLMDAVEHRIDRAELARKLLDGEHGTCVHALYFTTLCSHTAGHCAAPHRQGTRRG